MKSLEIARPQAGFSIGGWAGTLHPWVVNRWALTLAGLTLAGSGLTLGWSWLTAIGVAPLIVAAAPCLVMCAVGACVMCRSNPGANTSSAAPTETSPPVSEE
jgi:hypothetical protein